jgi:hypothetical protein
VRLTDRFSSLLAVSVVIATALLGQMPATSRADVQADLQTARSALAKYQDPITAVRDGYYSTVACVQFNTAGTLNGMAYPAGAMGVHFINMALIGKLDPAHPQVLIYEPAADGTLKLAAAEWFVPYAKGMKAPQMFGHTFYGPMMGHYPVMPAQLIHYDLHVWLWSNNPSGMFAPTNSAIKCPANAPYTFVDKTPQMPGMHM